MNEGGWQSILSFSVVDCQDLLFHVSHNSSLLGMYSSIIDRFLEDDIPINFAPFTAIAKNVKMVII